MGGDKFDQAAALSKRPSATIKGATIAIDSPALYFNVLRLEDAALETGGRAVTIEAVKVETVWDPPWDKDRMSEAAKLELGID